MITFAIDFPNIGPEIFSIPIGSFELALRWYALAYIIGILVGWGLMNRTVARGDLWRDGPPISREQIDDFVTWAIIGVILGGRLGYVFFYEPARFLAAPGDIVKVWQGGMAFHGGLAGVVVAAILFARRNKVAVFSLADLLALATPTGLFLGRTANFINGELWGAATDKPWGVNFPGPAAQNCGQALGEVCARHPSQLYEALLEGLILGLVLLWLAYRRGALKRPGFLAGVFFIGYSLSRFLVEFVRQADDQFITLTNPNGYVVQFGAAGLSMGQVLSIPMLVFGIYLMWQSRARHD